MNVRERGREMRRVFAHTHPRHCIVAFQPQFKNNVNPCLRLHLLYCMINNSGPAVKKTSGQMALKCASVEVNCPDFPMETQQKLWVCVLVTQCRRDRGICLFSTLSTTHFFKLTVDVCKKKRGWYCHLRFTEVFYLYRTTDRLSISWVTVKLVERFVGLHGVLADMCGPQWHKGCKNSFQLKGKLYL